MGRLVYSWTGCVCFVACHLCDVVASPHVLDSWVYAGAGAAFDVERGSLGLVVLGGPWGSSPSLTLEYRRNYSCQEGTQRLAT